MATLDETEDVRVCPIHPDYGKPCPECEIGRARRTREDAAAQVLGAATTWRATLDDETFRLSAERRLRDAVDGWLRAIEAEEALDERLKP